MIGFLANRKHARLRELVSSFIDDQVTASERREVEEHLASCESCRLGLESMRFTVELLNDLPQIESRRDFTLTSAPEAVPVRRSAGWATGLATSLAAMLLVALLLGDITGLLTQTHQLEQQAQSLSRPSTEASSFAAPAAPAPAFVPVPPSAPRPAPAPAPMSAAAPAVAPTPAAAMAAEARAQAESQDLTQPALTQILGATPAPASGSSAGLTEARTREAEAVMSQTESVQSAQDAATEKETTSLSSSQESPTPTIATLSTGIGGEIAASAARPQPIIEEPTAPPRPTPAPLVPERTPVPLPTIAPSIELDADDNGLSLPLRQLELAVGSLVLLLAIVTLWVRVSRRPIV